MGKVSTLGQAIRRYRLQNALGQYELAKELGMTAVSVCLWEKDKVVPAPATIKRLASIFNIDIVELTKHIK